jgi:hypothetical protein
MIDNKIPIASDIRMFCRKGIYYSRKDGAQVVFNRSYAIEWKRREDFSKNFFENPENSIKNVKNIAKENISFIKSLNNSIGFPEPIFYNNDELKFGELKKMRNKIKNFLLWTQKWTKTDMLYLAKGGFGWVVDKF